MQHIFLNSKVNSDAREMKINILPLLCCVYCDLQCGVIYCIYCFYNDQILVRGMKRLTL